MRYLNNQDWNLNPPYNQIKAPESATAIFKHEILALSVAHFVHDVYSSFPAPLLPFLIEKLSMSLTQAGFLSAVMQIPVLLNAYIVLLPDRIGLNATYLISAAMGLIGIPFVLMLPRK